MGSMKIALAGLAALGLAGCGNFGPVASEVAPMVSLDSLSNPRDYSFSAINVVVPESLTVSEAHSYFPNADIVWREDPPGDRREQIPAVFAEAAARGTEGFDGSRSVELNIVVQQFHASQNARATAWAASMTWISCCRSQMPKPAR